MLVVCAVLRCAVSCPWICKSLGVPPQRTSTSPGLSFGDAGHRLRDYDSTLQGASRPDGTTGRPGCVMNHPHANPPPNIGNTPRLGTPLADCRLLPHDSVISCGPRRFGLFRTARLARPNRRPRLFFWPSSQGDPDPNPSPSFCQPDQPLLLKSPPPRPPRLHAGVPGPCPSIH